MYAACAMIFLFVYDIAHRLRGHAKAAPTMPGKLPRTTVYVSPENRERLQEIARRFAILQTRGSGTGESGSLSALMTAIAEGRVLVRTATPVDDEET